MSAAAYYALVANQRLAGSAYHTVILDAMQLRLIRFIKYPRQVQKTCMGFEVLHAADDRTKSRP